jgi:hypothetical protein
MQYELERAYHTYREQAASHARRTAEAEQQLATRGSFARLMDTISARVRRNVDRRSHGLAPRQGQVAIG